MTDHEEASKDQQITHLIGKAEKLVIDLNDTVATMKRILTAASADIQEAKDAQHPGQ